MDSKNDSSGVPTIKLGLPKGHMQHEVLKLLREAGVHVKISDRGYRPSISLENYNVKLLKPQNILEMLHSGTREVGFGGHDWVRNLGVDVEELLDTGLDPVRIVAAAPSTTVLEDAAKSGKELVIASEYETLTKEWIKKKGIKAKFVRAFGATESFPPDDADLIIDNTATGSTLAANGLKIIDVVLTSSTRLFCNKEVLKDPAKKKRIDELVLLMRSVLAGRERSMVEFNVSTELFAGVVKKLPSMRAPTTAKLDSDAGYAIKIAVKNKELPSLLPQLKEYGVTDIVVSHIHQIIP